MGHGLSLLFAKYNKVGTPKDSRLKNTITNTINWCKSKDFEMEYAQWHPGKDNLLHEFSGPFHLDMYKKEMSLDKKIKMVKDIWYSKNYQNKFEKEICFQKERNSNE